MRISSIVNHWVFFCTVCFQFCFTKTVYIVPFSGYNTTTFGTTEDELVFTRLKRSLNIIGYECKYIYTSQIEKLSNNDFEYLILLNYNKTPKQYLERLKKEKLVLMCFEPELVESENHDSSVHDLFGKVITCFDRFKGKKYNKFFYWPWVTASSSQKSIPFQKKKLATLINGCKYFKHPDELYSERLNVINFFEKLKTTDFEFYGRGWDSKKYANYRGSIPTISGKRDILEKYRFCFCFENIKNIPGYVSEKILDCLNSGCIPIYWGASNIDLYIPKNCYILREDFESWQDIYDFIKNMPEKKYKEYLDNIKKYQLSEAAFLFTDASFVDSVLSALFPSYDRSKVFNKQEIKMLKKKDAWLAKNLSINTKKIKKLAKNTKKKVVLAQSDPKSELWNQLKDFKATINKKFVIVIASYNNKDWFQKNLDSVFMQKYSNYRIIYVDDCSSDGTGSFVEQYIKDKKQAHKVTLIKNTMRLGAMANFYNSINQCDEHEIVVQLDGDDWLANDHVLNLLNNVYENPDVWLTYGQFEYYPSGEKGFCQQIPDDIIENNNFRSYKWLASALRTFYAGLFKSIKREDLLFEGDFVSIAHDMAIMIPMFEMAGNRCKFIPDILYIYNRTNPINDDKVNHSLQLKIDQLIRAKKKYAPLKTSPLFYRKDMLWNNLEDFEPASDKNFVIVIASYNNKDWFQKNLDSVFMQKYSNYHVIYVDDCSSDGTGRFVEQYIKDKKQEHKVTLIKNTSRVGAMANFYNVINLCDKNEIIVQLDGDDWLANDHVLNLLNKVYANPDIWITYGQFEEYPSGKKGGCQQVPDHIIRDNEFRSYKWVTSALRSFYAGLFQLIAKEDVLLNGSFFPSTHDLAIMFPMLEMAGFKSTFIPDILYVYNRSNSINDNKVNMDLQLMCEHFIRGKQRYVPLNECPYNNA